MAAADEEALGALHNKVATVLTNALDGQALPEVIDEDGTVIQEATTLPISGAVLTAAIQFLKNNNITCAPSDDNALGALKKKMEDRQAKRASKTSPTPADLANATNDMQWLDGKMGHA